MQGAAGVVTSPCDWIFLPKYDIPEVEKLCPETRTILKGKGLSLMRGELFKFRGSSVKNMDACELCGGFDSL